MKSIGKLIIFGFALLALAASAYAQSPREQLKLMVEQLQKTPADHALRERIIKLAGEIKPSPAVPEEARRHFVRGSAVAQLAKDAKQQMLAVEAYQEALKIAPWWGDAYYNQGVAQELAGKLDDAGKSFKLYILANPGGKEARDAQDRIYALEGKKQLAESDKQSAEIAKISGKWKSISVAVELATDGSSCTVVGSQPQGPVPLNVDWCKTVNKNVQLHLSDPRSKYWIECEFSPAADGGMSSRRINGGWDDGHRETINFGCHPMARP
jgi:tetratricopeptide (TPR) repeat protein